YLASVGRAAAADAAVLTGSGVDSAGDCFSVRSWTSALCGGAFTSSADAAETERPLTAEIAHHALPATATTPIAAAAPSQIDTRRAVHASPAGRGRCQARTDRSGDRDLRRAPVRETCRESSRRWRTTTGPPSDPRGAEA